MVSIQYLALLNESMNPFKVPFLQERDLGRGLSNRVADSTQPLTPALLGQGNWIFILHPATPKTVALDARNAWGEMTGKMGLKPRRSRRLSL
jgi:hypothetical protein